MNPHIGSANRNAMMARRVASRYILARNVKQFLAPLLDSLQPYVKNYRTFLDQAAGYFGYQELILRDPTKIDFKTTKISEGSVSTDMQIGGFRGTRRDYETGEGPPEYAEYNFEYPSEWLVTVTYKIPYRELARDFAKLSAVRDRRGFLKRFLELLDNKSARLALLKLFRDGLKKTQWGEIFDNSEMAVEKFMEEFADEADEGVDVPTPASLESKHLKSSMKDAGSAGVLSFTLKLWLPQQPDVEVPEPDYDY